MLNQLRVGWLHQRRYEQMGGCVRRMVPWQTCLVFPGANVGIATDRALTVRDALSASARLKLLDWLRHNTTGNNRLRAKLPRGWQAGEKTGTSAYETSNDVGLLWPPGGSAPLLVAAYLTEGPTESATRDAMLADVGAAVARASA